jgi:hypothetical protein
VQASFPFLISTTQPAHADAACFHLHRNHDKLTEFYEKKQEILIYSTLFYEKNWIDHFNMPAHSGGK